MSQQIECDELTIRGRLVFSRRVVTAAELLATTPPGLLDMTPSSGAMVVVEPGAVIRGIRLCGYPDADTGDTTDETDQLGPELTCMFSIVADTGAIAAMNEDETIDEIHRLQVLSATGGADADGAVGRNPVLVSYNWNAKRWRFPWSAP